MSANRNLPALIFCSLLCFGLFPPNLCGATDFRRGLEAWDLLGATDTAATGAMLLDDTAGVYIAYSYPHPGSRDFLLTMYLNNPVTIAGFEFEIIINPADLADFSTVQWYMDSLDTCPDPEVTCWDFHLIRECLIEPAPLIGNWSILEAHGAPGDSSSSACDTLWMVGIAFAGTPIPPQPGYVPLLSFGIDAGCISDTVADRTVVFGFTGQLSSPLGESVPFRSQPGKADLLGSIPGNAKADSLVDLGDVVFLLNYLYKNGPEPCAMESADPNADCVVDLGDAIYLINFLFRGGPSPQFGCAH
jgi:hypothetical protein